MATQNNLRITLESKPGKQLVCVLDYEKGEITEGRHLLASARVLRDGIILIPG